MRYASTPQITDTHATVSISGPPELAQAIWKLITETGINPEVTGVGEIEGVTPAYVTGGTFGDDRRNPGFISVRYANLIYHTET
jgi:hypothetical protein